LMSRQELDDNAVDQGSCHLSKVKQVLGILHVRGPR
jgi:hypothetical protein